MRKRMCFWKIMYLTIYAYTSINKYKLIGACVCTYTRLYEAAYTKIYNVWMCAYVELQMFDTFRISLTFNGKSVYYDVSDVNLSS